MRHYIVKKRKLWVIKAVDSRTGRGVAWVLGQRDEKTFKRLYEKVKHLENCVFCTDNWDAFAKVLTKDRHIIGKSHTHMIESNNSTQGLPLRLKLNYVTNRIFNIIYYL